ncbi:FAD-dependent monooxygenase [Amycolatopsis sp. NBC_01488]|uniref:FAD-dependent monooxygenase n=1 Tax=Amycolatopsis sp. NBC_01488 TaxID=2903563 RepID=UPI002E2A4023|nr:FAD-dependent monooxygenase [Amycolatopsis sp. NBC_01488]
MTDVLIAGAGPAGLLTAAELAMAGVSVTVLERRAGPGLPRPVGLQPRTAELFDLRGLDTGPAQDGPSGHFGGLPVPLDYRVWQTRHPRVLLSALLHDGRGLLLDLGDHPEPPGFRGQVGFVRAATTDAGYRGRLLLVRPDGYAGDPADLARWFG